MLDTPAFKIEELSGQRRTVVLTGRGLPYRPLEVTTEQRVEVDWLPGSPHAVPTVLGPRDVATSLQGGWRAKYLVEDTQVPAIQVNNSPVPTLEDAVDLFDSLCREGQLLKVTWHVVTRVGFLSKWAPTWYDNTFLEWAIDFTWTGRDERPGTLVVASGTQSPASALSLLEQARRAISRVSAARIPHADDILSAVQSVQRVSAEAILSAQQLVLNSTESVLRPYETLIGLITTISSLEDEYKYLLQAVESRVMRAAAAGAENPSDYGLWVGDAISDLVNPPNDNTARLRRAEARERAANMSTDEAAQYDVQNQTELEATLTSEANTTARPASVSSPTPAPSELIDSERARRDIARRARTMVATLQEQRDAFVVQLGNTDTRMHVARAGENLRDLAERYYGDASLWRALLVHNNLNSSELYAGQLIVIPARLEAIDAGKGPRA
jgi:nucleoid-associated protein YgaU